MIEDNLQIEKINELKEAFEMFDRDKDGYINKRELGCVLRSIGQDPTDDELSEMLEEIAKNEESHITFEDLKEIMSKNLRQADGEEELVESFKIFDKEGNGLISTAEFKHIMLTLGEKLPEEEVDEMIKEADPNGEGSVNYRELAKKIIQQQ